MYMENNIDLEKEEKKDEKICEMGQVILDNNKHNIHLLTIIGEIEGHENLPSNAKSTKYEHILPTLAAIEDNENILEKKIKLDERLRSKAGVERCTLQLLHTRTKLCIWDCL